MTKSEALVYKLCTKSFLSLWSYPNPTGKKGKELCDILVVCQPDVIIFSVKEIEFKDTGDKVGWERWRKKAIEESCSQIHGAERWINSNSNIINQSGETGLLFPNVSNRKVHRIAVALGGKGDVALHFGDFGKGFVHVFDEISLEAIMNELDTISDFVSYLSRKEDFYYQGKQTLLFGEEDLLALYLANNRNFPAEPTDIVLDNDLWKEFQETPQIKGKKELDKISYIWDEIIEEIHQTFLDSNFIIGNSFSTELSDIEKAVRIMAREDRYARRRLAISLTDFLQTAKIQKIKSRINPNSSSMDDVIYVFQTSNYDADREANFNELQLRCVVARGLNLTKTKVLGILVEFSNIVEGSATSLCFLEIKDWTKNWQEKMELVQSEMRYFVSPSVKKYSEDAYTKEYPEFK